METLNEYEIHKEIEKQLGDNLISLTSIDNMMVSIVYKHHLPSEFFSWLDRNNIRIVGGSPLGECSDPTIRTEMVLTWVL